MDWPTLRLMAPSGIRSFGVPTGCEDSRVVEPKATVTVLTPACTVKVLAAGYVPEVHPSAG